MLDNLQLFIKTIDAGSLTQAAQQLGTTVATVSRRLDALEHALGRKLLYRSTRGLTLTQDGENYYHECAQKLEVLAEVLSDLDQGLNSLAGSLRVLAPGNFANEPLTEFWAQFIRRYPQISLRVDAQNQRIGLRENQADLAIRIGPLESSSLIHRRLGHVDTFLVGRPDTWDISSPQDIHALPTVSTDSTQTWRLHQQDASQNYLVDKQHTYSANDLAVVTAMIKSGQAIGLLPFSAAYHAMEQGELVRLLPDWYGPMRHVSILWPERKSRSIRAKVFEDTLVRYLANQAWFTPL